MKRILVLLAICFIIVSIISVKYMNYKLEYSENLKHNLEFEKIYQKEIYGLDLTTIINKAINNNEKNNVKKNEKKEYIDNNINSINIEIKITDTEETYPMEFFYNGGMQEFILYYKDISFKCDEIKYHKHTGKIKYLHFTQTSE